MSETSYFKPWLGHWEWGIRIGLFIVLLTSLAQFGLFAMTQNYMVGYLGAEPQDISFALLLTYAGIASILPIQFRFGAYFQTRSYLIVNLALSILINLILVQNRDMTILYILRFC